jgi:hypothetical protein
LGISQKNQTRISNPARPSEQSCAPNVLYNPLLQMIILEKLSHLGLTPFDRFAEAIFLLDTRLHELGVQERAEDVHVLLHATFVLEAL